MTVLDKLLQPVWEISPEPIVITGNEGNPDDRRILYVNKAFTLVTGFTADETIGKPPAIVHGPLTDHETIHLSEEQLRMERPQEYTLLHYRKDKSSFHCTISRAPLLDLDCESEYLISIWRVGRSSSPGTKIESLQPGSVPLTLPLPLIELLPTTQPAHLESHPELDALRDLWLEVCGSRALPSRQDFDLRIMRRWASHVSVALVTADGRFQFRLFGSALSDVYGRDLTGCFLDELTPNDLWSVVIMHYRDVVNTRQPLFAPISVSNGRWYTEVSRLLLPLSGNHEVNFIMGADYKRERL